MQWRIQGGGTLPSGKTAHTTAIILVGGETEDSELSYINGFKKYNRTIIKNEQILGEIQEIELSLHGHAVPQQNMYVAKLFYFFNEICLKNNTANSQQHIG